MRRKRKKFFISYRRQDAAGHVGRLADRLRERVGDANLFMDVESIDPGNDFQEAIEEAISSCDALLAVIGTQWLGCTDAAGKRRLDVEDDFVRREIATALRLNIRVIPVLVCGASLPRRSDLPNDIQALVARQGFAIRDDAFLRDADALINRLGGLTPHRQFIVYGAAAAAIVVIGLVWARQNSHVAPPDPSSFSLMIRVKLNDARWPPATPDYKPEMRFSPLKPKDWNTQELQAGRELSPREFEYSSHIIMPKTGSEYLGQLHRRVDSSVKTIDSPSQICFVRTAESLKAAAETLVRVNCRESGKCSIANDDVGWAASCPSDQTAQHASASFVAFAAPSPTSPRPAWVVPSLNTLRTQRSTGQNRAYTEFLISSGPLPGLGGADHMVWSVRVNGIEISVDGLAPEANAIPFHASEGIRLVFGLENLDFSGEQSGYENVELLLQFVSGDRVLARKRLALEYAALRSMENVTSEPDIHWKASYFPARNDRFQIFLVSYAKKQAAMDRKQQIDSVKLAIGGDTLVGVVRPPLRTNAPYGVALGVHQPSGQVKFTFDEKQARGLCSTVVSIKRSDLSFLRDAFVRDVDNKNFSRACNAF